MQLSPIGFTPLAFQANAPAPQTKPSALQATPADAFTPSVKMRQGNSSESLVEAIIKLREKLPEHIKVVEQALRWHGNTTAEHTAQKQIVPDITELVALQKEAIDTLGENVKALKEENALLKARANFNDPKNGGYSEADDDLTH